MTPESPAAERPADEALAAEIAAHRLWYHTLELPQAVTAGWFDLRPIVERMPWPDVRGKRCLDVGSWDGYLAFELERRGAAEVVATDIGDPADWDWSSRDRRLGVAALTAIAGEKNGVGFELAKRALGSAVERVEVSVYDLDPGDIGSFDVVVCGSLMLHLRDPVRALEAIRGVCAGQFLSAEQVSLDLSAAFRRTPTARFLRGENCQWWVPNVAGHRSMVETAGFRIERAPGAYAIPLGAGHPSRGRREGVRARMLARLLAGGSGVPHAAVLARPQDDG